MVHLIAPPLVRTQSTVEHDGFQSHRSRIGDRSRSFIHTKYGVYSVRSKHVLNGPYLDGCGHSKWSSRFFTPAYYAAQQGLFCDGVLVKSCLHQEAINLAVSLNEPLRGLSL